MPTKKPKIRTMEALSFRIGVSRPTLSKYFHDAGSVRRSTRGKIEAALETLDYTPNFFATKMNRKTTGLIGVIVPYLNDLFFTSLIEAMDVHALQSDFMVITQTAHGDPQLEARAAKNLMAMNVDGVIIAPIGQSTSLEMISRLHDQMPVVFVDSRFPDRFAEVDFVGTNNRQSIALMVDYLCRSGEAPVFLSMPRINSNSLEREQAYADCAARLNFEPVVIPAGNASPGWEFEEYAFRIMDEHFSRGQFTTSTVLCANDRLAIGAIRAANHHKLFSRRRDSTATCRIAGHDDHPLSAFVSPGLTTVTRNTALIAQAAIEQLVSQIRHGRRIGQGTERMFDAGLCLRESA